MAIKSFVHCGGDGADMFLPETSRGVATHCHLESDVIPRSAYFLLIILSPQNKTARKNKTTV